MDIKPNITFFLSSVLLSLLISSSAQTCNTTRTFTGNRLYSTCSVLPVLDSVLYWNYHQENHTVDIAYTHSGVTTSNWVSWALNTNGSGMAGADSLVAFQNSTGMRAYTSPITGHGTTLAEGQLSFNVTSISSEFNNNNNEIIISATLHLPAGRTSFNHLWQVGPLSGGVTPGIHNTSNNSANLRSMGSVDFSTGGQSISRRHRRDRKTIRELNMASAILMMVGAMVSKVLKLNKMDNSAGLCIHIYCQFIGYILGVAGWGMGITIGEQGSTMHRNIDIAIVCLGAIQLFVALMKPKKEDNSGTWAQILIFIHLRSSSPSRSRRFWNYFHRELGYLVIILKIINSLDGIEPLNLAEGWKGANIAFLVLFTINVAIPNSYNTDTPEG